MEKLPTSPDSQPGRPHRKAGQEAQHWETEKANASV